MALVVAVVLGTAAAPAMYVDSPSASPKKSPHGSYGTRDPEYDGFVPRCPLPARPRGESLTRARW